MILPKRRPNFKLSRNQKIAELYLDTSKKYSTNALAKMFNISPTRVSQIVKDWKAQKEFRRDQNHDKFERSKQIKEFSNWADKKAEKI